MQRKECTRVGKQVSLYPYHGKYSRKVTTCPSVWRSVTCTSCCGEERSRSRCHSCALPPGLRLVERAPDSVLLVVEVAADVASALARAFELAFGVDALALAAGRNSHHSWITRTGGGAGADAPAALVELLAAVAETEDEEATVAEEEAEGVCASKGSGRGPKGSGVEDELVVALALGVAHAVPVPELQSAVAESTEAATGASSELEVLVGITSGSRDEGTGGAAIV